MKKKLVAITGMLGIFIILPIWWYLTYKVLVIVEATELMWFLFWIYVPANLFVHVLTEVVKNTKDTSEVL